MSARIMAVYTQLTDQDLRTLASEYGFSSIHEVRPIAEGVENSNFHLFYEDSSGYRQRAILTLFEQRVQAVDIPFYLKLKEYLHINGYPCPHPLHTAKDMLFIKIADKYATIVSFLQGKSIISPDTQHIIQAGKALAQLHLDTQHFPMTRPNNLSLTGWHELYNKILLRRHFVPVSGWLSLIESELRYQTTHWPHHMPSGIIHADFFPNNVFFDDEGILCGVIDFYFACHDMYAYDLAILANAWCVKQHRFNREDYAALIKAYDTARPLSEAEFDALPLLLRAAALRFLLTRLHDVLYPVEDALVTPHDPQDYADILQMHRLSSAV